MTVLCAGKSRFCVAIQVKKNLTSIEPPELPIQNVTRALSVGLNRPALEDDYSPLPTLSLAMGGAVLLLPHTRAYCARGQICLTRQ